MYEDKIRFFPFLFMCGVSEDAEQANFIAKLVTVCVCVCTSERIQYYLRLQINVRMQ